MGNNLIRELIIILLVSVLLYAGINATVQNSEVVGPSMTPNLLDGERVIISKLSYKFGRAPERGDVVVFTPPSNLSSENDFIKRVIGLPGEIVEVKGGAVIIHSPDGSSFVLDESEYVVDPARYNFESEVIPAGRYLVLGDNRNNSNDSHNGGWTIPLEDFMGKAWVVIWPPAKWGGAPNYNHPAVAFS